MTHQVTDKLFPFLNGGGELGELTRTFDWSKTPLGSPEAWPGNLRLTLSLLLNSRFPMFLWWGNDLIQFYNDAYRPSLGNNGKHPKALGQRGEDCWPEIWSIIKPLIDQVLETGIATWSEDQLIPIYRNGKIEDVYWTFGYSPVNDESGKAQGVLVTCTETTEKVIKSNVLMEKEEQLRFAIDAAELGTWDFNPSTNRFIGNERLKEWFGLPLDGEIDLGGAIAAMAEGDRARVTAAIQKALDYNSGGSYDIEYRIVNPVTKLERIVSAKGRAWFNASKVAYRFNGTLQDITQQVKTRSMIEEAHQKATLAIASANLGTYEIDLVTDEMKTDDRFNVIWGVKGQLPRSEFASFIHADDREMRLKAHEESLVTGNLLYEARLIHRDKSIHWVRVNGKVSHDSNGKPVSLLGIIQDITDSKAFTDALNHQVQERTLELQAVNEELLATNEEVAEANSLLVKSNEALEQFNYATSHDMQEPLRKVQTFVNLLRERRGDNLDEVTRNYLAKIEASVIRLTAIITDLLGYSQSSVRRGQKEIVDLNKIVAEVENDLELVIQDKHAFISKENLPEISADRVQMTQLFQNLISNALKFSKPDVSPLVFITSRKLTSQEVAGRKALDGRREYFQVEVVDNGIGFRQEYAEHIFELFKRLHSKSQYEGTGIGLSLCKKIVENHYGEIYAMSEPEIGTAFRVILPYAQE